MSEPVKPDTTGASRLGGLGILNSISDLPKTQALGIELRATAALAVTLSAIDGSWTAEPYRVFHDPPLGDDPKRNEEIVCSTLKQIVKHFKWKGVVGISITKLVSKAIGIADDTFSTLEANATEILSKSLKGKASFVHVMIHTTAAGYSELVFGDSGADEQRWRKQVVLCCTLGKSVGAVLFNDGRRVRHREWCKAVLEELEEPDGCPPAAGEVGGAGAFRYEMDDLRFDPPAPGTGAWNSWTGAVDRSLAGMIDSVQGLDRVLVMPTGRTGNAPFSDQIQGMLVESQNLVAEKGCELELLAQPEGSVVRGAAICALVELESTQVLKQLIQVLRKADSIQSLSEPQLQYIFEQLDTAGDGRLSPLELQTGLEQLGVQRDMQALLKELDAEDGGAVSMEQFVSWWLECVRSARLVTLTSSTAWRKLLGLPPPAGFGDLICLEVTFTFCRACRRFDSKFRKLAEEYENVRFVQLVGNGTIGAMDLSTKELGVKKSPSFFIFRRGDPEPLASWTGTDVSVFRENIAKF